MDANPCNYIFHNEWGIATPADEIPRIRTARVGPEYVVTFVHSAGVVALAKVSLNTRLKSLEQVACALHQMTLSLDQVQVNVIGGWRECEASMRLGERLCAVLQQKGFSNLSTVHMFALPGQQYFHGVIADAATAQSSLVDREDHDLDMREIKLDLARLTSAKVDIRRF